MTSNKSALKAEAEETAKTFEYKGAAYIVETDTDKWSVETMLAYEDNKAVSVVRAILGPEQWNKFMTNKPTNKDFNEFTEMLFDELGITAGE